MAFVGQAVKRSGAMGHSGARPYKRELALARSVSETASTVSVGSVVCFDLGKVRVGVAVADLDVGLATPLAPLAAGDHKALLTRIGLLATEREAKRVLVGLPLELDGTRGPAAKRAIAFASEVANATGLEVELVDERLSTVEASRRLDEAGRKKGKGRTQQIDGAAAAVLLQAWLDRRARTQ
jgi:putative Holliday junction resolvase